MAQVTIRLGVDSAKLQAELAELSAFHLSLEPGSEVAERFLRRVDGLAELVAVGLDDQTAAGAGITLRLEAAEGLAALLTAVRAGDV